MSHSCIKTRRTVFISLYFH